ncbi:hypothetical protein LTR10_001796 [Elasticomyces elasticus]|nr:hypothetical protein LTR10_001796 [Elasticomyces elasticus]KAK4975294.1 hypothetical protein LTR42_004504 [Elasticomyces elasticus]
MPPDMAFSLDGSPESDDHYAPQTDKPKRKSAAGRELVRWDPDKDQLVLLCLDYVSGVLGVAIPWDQVAQMFGGLLGKTQTITGEALKQHLSKLYKYRVDFDLVVPPKLERTQRRKAVVPGVSSVNSTPAPTRPRAKKAAVKKEVKIETPSKPAGSGLLHLPAAKGKKAKAQPVTPKTPVNARGGGRKKRNDEVANSIELKEEESDSDFAEAPPVKKKGAGAHGNKRGRKAKSNAFVHDDDLESIITPSKKPKNDSYLRSLPAKNYSEQPQSDSEADAHRSGPSKKQSHSSQDSGIYNQSLPFRSDTNHSYQNYSQPPTPAYTYNHSGDATPFTPPASYGYGYGDGSVPGFRYAEQPAPQMQSYNGYEYGTPAATPRTQSGMFTFGNGFGDANTQHVFQTHPNGTGDHHTHGMVLKIENDTQLSNIDGFNINGNSSFSNMDGTISPASYTPGETGLTPDMAQTGFSPSAPVHTASFDSGFGGLEDMAGHNGHELDYDLIGPHDYDYAI